MKRRVLKAFSELKEDTVLVTHGGVIAAVMQHLFPEENKIRYEWQPKNGCGYCIHGHSYSAIGLKRDTRRAAGESKQGSW